MTRHVWQEALEETDENRYTYRIKEFYKYRKTTIERIFALSKELHGFRDTQEVGKAHMEVKAAFTYACLNLKEPEKRWKTRPIPPFLQIFWRITSNIINFCIQNPLPVMPAAGLSTV